MLVIGICGASGSGKSTLASELCKAIGDGCIIINHDSYYRDHSHLPFQDRALLNYDEPGIFDHDLFLQDIKTLMAGKPITYCQMMLALNVLAELGILTVKREKGKVLLLVNRGQKADLNASRILRELTAKRTAALCI